MPNKLVAATAADNLKKKTSLPWAAKEEPLKSNNYILVLETQIKSPSWHEGETAFQNHLKAQGIDFAFQVRGTEKGANLGTVWITARLSNPLEIEGLSKNKFTYPQITREEGLKAVETLQKTTQLPWELKESNKKIILSLTTEVKAKTWEEEKVLFKNKLNQSGINFNLGMVETQKGAKENFVNILANISNPLEIQALSAINKPSQIIQPKPQPTKSAIDHKNRSMPVLITNYSQFANSEQRGDFINKYLALPSDLKDEVLKGQTYDDLKKLQDSLTRYFPDFQKKYSDGYNEIHNISTHLEARQSKQENMADIAADYLRQNPVELRKLFSGFKNSNMTDFDISVNKGKLHVKGLNTIYQPPKLYQVEVEPNKIKHFASIEPASKQTLLLAKKLNDHYKTANQSPQNLNKPESPAPIAPPRKHR